MGPFRVKKWKILSVFEDMCIKGYSPDQIIESKGLKQITDDDSIEKVVDEVIENNSEQVKGYKSGKEKLFGFFVGQVMKKTQGKANPQTVNKILKDKLAK